MIPINEEPIPNGMVLCDCCDSNVFKLAKMAPKKRADNTDNLGMKNIVTINSMDELNDAGIELVEWCLDFLLFYREGYRFQKSTTQQHYYYNDKYITIWSFIYDFLKIPKNSGYDYWLMSFLEHIGIMKHGTGIRCGFLCMLDSHLYANRVLSLDRRNKIIEWGTNAPDEL